MDANNFTLTQDALLNMFEYRDGHLFWKINKRRVLSGKKAGCIRNDGYVVVRLRQKQYAAHRIIFMMHNGWLPDHVDHIDCNRLNNKIENLRAATKSENLRNACKHHDKGAGPKGVYWNKKSKKWQANLYIDGKLQHLGLFDDLDTATLVVMETRERVHGDFYRHQ